jgi:putative endonuclease
MKQPAVYIMANKRNGTLYTGVTSNLVQRVYWHRNGSIRGFTSRYGCKMLVWYELHEDMASAIAREKPDQGWVTAQEARIDRSNEPRLARFVRRHRVIWRHCEAVAKQS